MKLKIKSIDYAPDDLYEQIPFTVNLIKKMKGPDRPDYWLAKIDKPLLWKESNNIQINYVILASRYVGTTIREGMGRITLGLAYVVDESLLEDDVLLFNKCKYIAICEAEEINQRKGTYMQD